MGRAGSKDGAGSPLAAKASAEAAANSLLRLGHGPWTVIAGAREHNLTEQTLQKLEKLVPAAASQHESVHVLLPNAQDGAAVWHVAISAPVGAGGAMFRFPPTLIIRADRAYMLWALRRPVAREEAGQVSHKLAQAVGGRSLIGGSVPLPGTMLYKKVGWQMGGVSSVIMNSVTPYTYLVMNGELIAPPLAAPQAATQEAGVLSVDLGEAEDGSRVAWEPGRQANGHFILLGSSGSGKTSALKMVGDAIHRFGVPLLSLDPHGDIKVPGLRDVLLSSGSDSTLGLNPLELDGASAGKKGLYDQREAILTLIHRACPTLGDLQMGALRTGLEAAYAGAGIKDDDPATWKRSPPTFASLMRELDLLGEENTALVASIAGLKSRAIKLFGHPIFRRADAISMDDLLARSTHLDLSHLEDNVRFVAMETLLLQIFRALRARGHIPVSPANDRERFRLFVMLDEAQILALGGGANVLGTLFAEARKFGLAMILATQEADNFPETVRNNAAAWLVLKPQIMKEAAKNAPNMRGITPDQLMALRGDGDGYFRGRTGNATRLQVRMLGGK